MENPNDSPVQPTALDRSGGSPPFPTDAAGHPIVQLGGETIICDRLTMVSEPSEPPPENPVARAWRLAAECVPTTWLDSLLSGQNAVLARGGKWDCHDIERLLSAIKERIMREANTACSQPGGPAQSAGGR